jgi:putative heme-binding domain-containing protein
MIVATSLAAMAVSSLLTGSTMAKDAQWIWAPVQRPASRAAGTCLFRRTFQARGPHSGSIEISSDQQYVLYVNGVKVGGGDDWTSLDKHEISAYLVNGQNVIAVEASKSKPGPAGMVAYVRIQDQQGKTTEYHSDAQWRTHVRRQPGWQQPRFSDLRWFAARSLGEFGTAKPWLTTTRQPLETQAPTTAEDKKPSRFEVRPEFRVQWVVKPEGTGSLLAMTFDEFGNILASRENGPLLLIIDRDKDGVADDVTVYCDKISNCQGILAMNGEVYATADGPDGAALYRLQDDDRDGVADKVQAVVRFQGDMQEHGPHGLRLGPDGLIYMVCGNMTQLADDVEIDGPHRFTYEGDVVQPRREDPRGHARDVKAPGGTILRTGPAGKNVERFAGGLRNAYDIVFDRHGELFTWDSDMAWDNGMPWYRPTRIHHVTAGAEFGWRSGWAKWPEYFADSLPAMLDTGRAGPTGMVCYDHFMFPVRFHGTMFVGDWMQGRILAIKMKRRGATYTAESSVFVEGHPLNVTDLEVGPDGWLYFCTGGRDTEGGIYRVVWTGTVPKEVQDLGEGIEIALRHPQLHTAWSRQRIALIRQRLGKSWDRQLQTIVKDQTAESKRRTRAIDLMQLYGPLPDTELSIELSRDTNQHVRSEAAYLLGLHPDPKAAERLTELLDDPDQSVRRLAAESLIRGRYEMPTDKLVSMLGSTDQFLAWAVAKALQTVPAENWKHQILTSESQRVFLMGSTALLSADPDKPTCLAVIDRCQKVMNGYVADENFVDLLRVCQLALHRGQLAASEVPQLFDKLSGEFPSGDATINRELVRLLAYLESELVADRYVNHLKTDLDAADKIHMIVHAPHLISGMSTEQRLEVLKLSAETRERLRHSTHMQYVDAAIGDFAGRLTDIERVAVFQQAEKWPHAALRAIATLPEKPASGVLQQLRTLDQQLVSREDDNLKKLRIGIAAALARSKDPAAMAYLRKLFDDEPERRGVLTLALVQDPNQENWPYLIRALPILRGDGALDIIKTLTSLDLAPQKPEPVRQVILHGLRQTKDEPRRTVIALLEKWTGQHLGTTGAAPEDILKYWQQWFENEYPNEPVAELPVQGQDDAYTAEEIKQHLSSDLAKDANHVRGAFVFRKAQCASCHRVGDEGRGPGPDLTTIAQRFQQEEIIQAILFPSHAIADRYSTRTLRTDSGQVFKGVAFREKTSGDVIMLDSTGKRTRVARSEVKDIDTDRTSSMPAGLLNDLSPQEIADLFAFLRQTPQAGVTARGGAGRPSRLK